MAKTNASYGGERPAEYKMPDPPAVVVWRNDPSGDSSYAIVTRYNRYSVNLMIFPPDSRVGVPKDGVRFEDDPWNKTNGINPDSGVWGYTAESLLLAKLAGGIHPKPETF